MINLRLLSQLCLSVFSLLCLLSWQRQHIFRGSRPAREGRAQGLFLRCSLVHSPDYTRARVLRTVLRAGFTKQGPCPLVSLQLASHDNRDVKALGEHSRGERKVREGPSGS